MIQKNTFRFSVFALFIALLFSDTSLAQQYKIRQSSGMMGMNSEPTIYVEGMRKRTEPGKMMGMQQPITIEQCDLQRTIKINDKKKLYFIEPFAKQQEEIIDEDAPKPTKQPAPKTKPTTTQTGGVIEMWYTITDTGERKKMYGFTARHVWTYQKMKPSANACYMKDSMIIKTDGWYIDLPQFNCPVHYSQYNKPQDKQEKIKPDCKDRMVTHRKGKGKLGFPLEEKTTIIMGSLGGQEMTTTMNTIEFSTAKLDSMLFEIPPGYTETKNEDDLMDKINVMDMMNDAMKGMNDIPNPVSVTSEQKKEGIIRIGVYAPTGNDEVQAELLQKQMLAPLMSGKTEAIAVADEAEARKYNCDYTLSSEITKAKAASKVGGLLKAIKNADPSSSQSFNIEAGFTLRSLADGLVKSQPTVSGKYNGKIDTATGEALQEGCRKVLKDLK